MITCKVGNSIINCMNDIYDKHKLKKWSNENRLICPDCGKPYEYCHGEIKTPYFRHKEKNTLCDEIYHELETQEHIDGKVKLYNWLLSIKDKCNITNIHLEYYIKETRQKPDLYFEQNGNRYVIEYQCTPIATEFLERRELYRLANITDIWILGTEKYSGKKTIEKHTDFHFNSSTNQIQICNIDNYILNSNYYGYIPEVYDINNILFINGTFNLDHLISEELRDNYVKHMIDKNLSNKKQDLSDKIIKSINSVAKYVAQELSNLEFFGEKFKVYYYENHTSRYICSLLFSGYEIFVKYNYADLCWYKQYNCKYGKYINENNCEYELTYNDMSNKLFELAFNKLYYIAKKIKYHKDFLLQQKQQHIMTYGKYLNKEILLINGKHIFNNDKVRFKFLNNFKLTDEYIENDFMKEIDFLNNRHAKKYIFMIPKYNWYHNNFGISEYISVYDLENVILEKFKEFGFNNIRFINDSYEE